MSKIAVWPDGSWCEEEDIEDSIRIGSGYAKSDDYMVVEVPDDVEDIDTWVAENNPNRLRVTINHRGQLGLTRR